MDFSNLPSQNYKTEFYLNSSINHQNLVSGLKPTKYNDKLARNAEQIDFPLGNLTAHKMMDVIHHFICRGEALDRVSFGNSHGA